MTETEIELLKRVANIPFEVVSIQEDNLAPSGSVRVRLRIDPADVERGAIPLLFALTGISFSEGRPAGASDIAYEGDDDAWTAADLLAHLEVPARGGLRVYLDYIRGRMLKTTIDVTPDGQFDVLVVNRGSTARRWVEILRGRRHLQAVGAATAPQFLAPSGAPLLELDDWRRVHPPEHWREGRSAVRLARSWCGVADFPTNIGQAWSAERRFDGLRLVDGRVEYECQVPGHGKGSVTDIMLRCADSLGNPVIVAVEGKVDEGFGPLVRDWLVGGRGARSAENRGDRLGDIVVDLGFSPDDPSLPSLRYQLLHRTWSAWQTARDEGALTAVVLIHSFGVHDGARAGWADFVAFAGLLKPGEEAPRHCVPWAGPRLDGVDLWLLWVSEE